MPVPCRATAQTGPVLSLEKQIPDGNPDCAAPNRFYAYGVVARLALLAAMELERMEAALEVHPFPRARAVNT